MTVSNQFRASIVRIVIASVVALTTLGTSAWTQGLPSAKSAMAVPWSGILKTELENVAVAGELRVLVDSVFRRRTVFTKIQTSVVGVTALGLATGQTFSGTATFTNTCSVPGRVRGGDDEPFEFAATFQLTPSGRITTPYRRVRERSLPLISRVTFGDDGRLAGMVVRVGATGAERDARD